MRFEYELRKDGKTLVDKLPLWTGKGAVGLTTMRPGLYQHNSMGRLSNVITTWFCPPMDLVFLQDSRVMEVHHDVQPSRFVVPKYVCNRTLELPAGLAKEWKIAAWDKLEFVLV